MIDSLHRLLPASVATVTAVNNITADKIMAALDEQGLHFAMNRLGLRDWEIESSEMTDKQILDRLRMDEAGHHGELLICTEACSRYGYEPFKCHSSDLVRFVTDYDIEMFFDGDVVMLCEDSRTLTVYHHAGGYFHRTL